MRHSIVLEFEGYRLRPVSEDDSEFIVQLRNAPHVSGKMGVSAKTADQQNMWLQKYYDDKNDYYFIIEGKQGQPIGTNSVYSIDTINMTGETGRLAFISGYSGSALLCASIMLSDFCFYSLKLKSTYGNIVANNQAVISLNKRVGYQIANYIPKGLKIGDDFVDAIHMVLMAERWNIIRPKLMNLVASFRYLTD